MSRQASAGGGLKVTIDVINLALKKGKLKDLVEKVYAPNSGYSRIEFARALIDHLGEESAFTAIKDHSGLPFEEREQHKAEVRKAIQGDSAIKIPERRNSPENKWEDMWPLLGDKREAA